MRVREIRAHKLKAKAMLIPLIRPFTDVSPCGVRIFIATKHKHTFCSAYNFCLALKLLVKLLSWLEKTGGRRRYLPSTTHIYAHNFGCISLSEGQS